MKSLNAGQGPSVWVLSDRYTIKASGDQTGGAFALIEGWVPPGGGPPQHVHHREDESFYVLEGEVTFIADHREIAAGPGSFIHLPRGLHHRFRNTGTDSARLLILVSPAGLERMFLEAGVAGCADLPPPFGPADIRRLVEVAARYGIEIEA